MIGSRYLSPASAALASSWGELLTIFSIVRVVLQTENARPLDTTGFLELSPRMRPQQAPGMVKELMMQTWGVPGVSLEADGWEQQRPSKQLRLTQWGTPIRYALRTANPPPTAPAAQSVEATGRAARRGRADVQNAGPQACGSGARSGSASARPRSAESAGSSRAQIKKRKRPASSGGRSRICLACDLCAPATVSNSRCCLTHFELNTHASRPRRFAGDASGDARAGRGRGGSDAVSARRRYMPQSRHSRRCARNLNKGGEMGSGGALEEREEIETRRLR